MATQADTVVTTIPVGSTPVAVAINPAGTFAYVANTTSNNVSKINLGTDTVVATISVGNAPYDVAINPAGTFAYVVNSQSRNVSKIDVAADTVVATIAVGEEPFGIKIDPAGTFAYLTHSQSSNVSKINLATDTVVATIGVGSNPIGIAINPAGTLAYVTNYGSNTVSKINLATDTVVATISVESSPGGVVIDPAGTFAYVATANQIGSDSRVSKISLASDTVVATIPVGSNPYSMAINPAGTFAYLTNTRNSTVSKISLATFMVAATISVGPNTYGVAINPAGTFVYLTEVSNSNKVSKIAISATDSQTITFTPVSTQLLGATTVALSVTASSALAVITTSATPVVCTVSGATVTMLTTGECTITANQSGGSGWDAAPEVSQSFTILPSPPAGEVGVSIRNGDSYSNTKQVTLNLIWPAYATAARISNDGGFSASKTETKNLSASIDWALDDSVKGIYTKVVYVRFNGVADTTKTYSDDIILDTTAPTIETSTAVAGASSVDLSLKATDDITGVNKVEIRNDTKIVTKDYATKVSVPLTDLSITVSTSGVRKSATTAVEIRVSDNAGNWTGWQTVTVAGLTKTPVVTTPEVKTPSVTTKKAATAKSIAAFAKLKVLSTSKVSLKVISRYAKYCKVSGTTLRGLKTGTCKVTVTLTPKKGKATSKTVTLKVTK